LQLALPEIKSLGANLVAISPQLPDGSLSTVEQHALEFEVLSDTGNRVAREFGLVFKMGEALRETYQGFGLDWPAINGDDSFELPLTATYVIDTNGTIAHDFVDTDYCKRLEPAEILAVLRTLRDRG
jgi:peroxiredoxin